MFQFQRNPRVLGALNSVVREVFSGRRAGRVRNRMRLPGGERFEDRKLLALSIQAITTPADNATNVDLNTDLVLTFNEPVLKGQGNIYVVKQNGEAGAWVDVRSADVTVSGSQVSVNLPQSLMPDNMYSVRIDPGAFVDTSATPTAAATLLTQNFDMIPLGSFVNEGGGDGTDFTTVPTFGFTSATTLDPTKGIAEWRGWSWADRNAWVNAASNQSRDQFTRASGTIMVADTDEYDDGNSPESPWRGYSYTKPVDLTGVAANSVKLEFDSSFRPEGPGDSQVGLLDVSYDGGTTWGQLLRLDETNTSNAGANNLNLNERLVSGTTSGVTADGKGGILFGAVNNPSQGSLVFRFYTEGSNDWWWGIDNMLITGAIQGVPFAGLSDSTTWNFSTPESPRLSLSIDAAAISENGGVATATLSRNASPLAPPGPVVVTLTSNDTTEATVPTTVTIPDGQLSVTFPITAVDDTLSDRTQTVVVSATASQYSPASASLLVLDDEGPKVVSVTPLDNATGVSYQTTLAITFDRAVRKGAGLIRVVAADTGFRVVEIDVADSSVVVSGSTMTVTLPALSLRGLTEFRVLIDDGTVTDTSSVLTAGSVLLTENFDTVPRAMFPDGILTAQERTFYTAPGPDYGFGTPRGFAIDNSQMAPGGSSPFEGWSFMTKGSWVAEQGDQGRARFNRGSGTVAVADSDAWDDYPHGTGAFNSFLVTRPIDLAGITPGSVTLEFDSSYYPELPQYGQVQVTYDGGATWLPLLFFGDANNRNDGRNDRIVVSSASAANSQVGGGTVEAPLNSPATGSMQFRFGLREGANNWWWAVDNVVIRGERAGEPFAGVAGDAWTFTTGVAPVLSVSLAAASIAESGASTTTGTVSRNLDTTGAVVVTLTSSDLTAVTVPATVTIPDGAASATFTVTAVNDTATDGVQTAVITASNAGFFSGSASISVLDDDFPVLVGVTPANGATGVSVDGVITLAFDMAVRKGNGSISIVDSLTGKAIETILVTSSLVTVSGSTATVDPVTRLAGLTGYYVRVDAGSFLSAAAAVSPNAPLLVQDFELVPLRPAVLEIVGLTANGRDWTDTPPAGWSRDTSQMPPGGAPEWRGWTYADKSFWSTQGGQSRANFILGSGTIAIADTDEWDDYARPSNAFNASMTSAPIDLATVAADSVTIAFDSSFRPEGTSPDMVGLLDVSFDGGTSWGPLVRLDYQNTNGAANAANVNRRESFHVANPGAGTMQFRWTTLGSNDWWWAIDNLAVTGTVNGAAFQGVTSATAVAFTTQPVQALSLQLPTTATEAAAATFTGTVQRDLGTTADLVVALASSDPLALSVPATVTIPAGQSSATFPVTIVNDSIYRGGRNVSISASATNVVSAAATVGVSDDELGSVVITEIMYDAAGPEPQSEWLELYNAGTTTVDLGGWKFSDEDRLKWDPIPAGTLLAPGKVAVVFNRWFGIQTAAGFRADWATAAPSDVVVVGVGWQDLANDPTTTNEVLTLRNAVDGVEDEANYQENGAGGWPTSVAGASFFLTSATADNNAGANWASSVAGVAGAVSAAGTTWNVADMGSPGSVPFGDVVVDVGSGQEQTDSTVRTGSDVIVKRGAGRLILDRANSHSGGLRVEAGEVVIRNASALNSGPLVVAAGAKVTIDVGTGRMAVSSLSLAPTSLLDLRAGGVVIGANGMTTTALRQALLSGSNGGAWNGTSGLTSSLAASTPGRAVGYAPGPNNSRIVAFSAPGDVDLNGEVDLLDMLAILGSGTYDTPTTAGWNQGDFNYDGRTDLLDIISVLGSNVYDGGRYLPAGSTATTPSSLPASGMTAVSPESAAGVETAAGTPAASGPVATTATGVESTPISTLAFQWLGAEQQQADGSAVKKRRFSLLS